MSTFDPELDKRAAALLQEAGISGKDYPGGIFLLPPGQEIHTTDPTKDEQIALLWKAISLMEMGYRSMKAVHPWCKYWLDQAEISLNPIPMNQRPGWKGEPKP